MTQQEYLEKAKNIANFLSAPGWIEIDNILKKMYSNSFKEAIDNQDEKLREEYRLKCIVIKEVYEKITKGLKIGEFIEKQNLEKITQEVNKYVK